jgi:hypothetical protein
LSLSRIVRRFRMRGAKLQSASGVVFLIDDRLAGSV